jgi:hypothetical protein
MNNDLLNISLKQGKQFNTYQNKIKQNITKSESKKKYNRKIEGFVSLEQEQIVRPKFDGYSPVLKNIRETKTSINNANQKDLDELKDLQTRYNELMQQYTDIQKKIGDSSLATINRIGSNNQYLGKNLQFTDGTVVYVTNQGIAKPYTSEEILNNTIGKNGCPTEIIKLNIPWTSEYIQGATIPTNPNLIVGSKMVIGQSCGNEGTNVYASKLINNPNSKYIGCYNDKPPSTNVNVVPVMNSSNRVNGFASGASSVYQNINDSVGAWTAFDQNPNTFWHSEVSPSTNYNDKTGIYEGSNGVSIVNVGRISGEFLQINMPGVNTETVQNITVNQYSLSPRLDAMTTRSPNSWYVIGYKDSQWYPVDRQQNQSFTNGTPKVYNVSNPGAYGSYILLVDKVGNNDQTTNRYCVQVAEWNLFMNSVPSDDERSMILSDINDYTSFDKCQDYAVNNGYNFFGLQDIQTNGNAKCVVSNDIARTKIYGDANAQLTLIPIWSSNTITGQSGSMLMSGSGQIRVFNSNSQEIFVSNPAVPECINLGTILINSATYGGNCKAPIGNVSDMVAGKLKCNFSESCSIPISNATFGDPAVGCAKSFDIEYKCGGTTFTRNLASAEGQTMILDCKDYMQSKCQFFLTLQNDGNLIIYKGKDPSNSEGTVWSSMTSGKQKAPNPDWISSKGKFGRNYMKTSETLASGEWIGSDDGSLKLIMQSDGNLVLYTSETKPGCKVIKDRTYGGNMINAVYELDSVGNRATLGNIGYIDSESKLREYPDSMVGFTNDYQIYQNTDSPGNDITSLVTPDQNGCQTACNNNPDCSAYVYQGSSQTCWLKNRSAFPKGNKQPNNSVVLGVRTPGLKGSQSCSNKITNIDTIQFDNYIRGDKMTYETQCNPSIVSQEDQIEYDNIISQLIILGNDIVTKMENLYNQDNKIFEKLNTNAEQFKRDLESYKLTNLKIKKNLQRNNIEGMQNLTNIPNINDLSGMLTDSELRVLKENYSYIMWSILAVGILTITINTMKK